MKLIRNNISFLCLTMLIGVSVFLLPSSAEFSETRIYQEVNTISSTGGQYSGGQDTESGSANVEVFSETNINGERFVYQFSTSSPNSIEHQVIIENGIPVNQNIEAYSTSNPTYLYESYDIPIEGSQVSNQGYQALINSMINLINSLKLLMYE
jgi:hypothetical protein